MTRRSGTPGIERLASGKYRVRIDGADPHVMVRYASEGKTPKNGKARRVDSIRSRTHGWSGSAPLCRTTSVVRMPRNLDVPFTGRSSLMPV